MTIPRREIRKSGIFKAVDENGMTHTVTVYTDFVEVTALNEPPTWLPGLESYELANGHHLNVREDGMLEDPRTGMKLRRLQ